jgi:hypothetical protein
MRNLVLARELLNEKFKGGWKATPARKEAIARYYQKNPSTLNHVESELRAYNTPTWRLCQDARIC